MGWLVLSFFMGVAVGLFYAAFHVLRHKGRRER
jgi:hypothetical protein